MTKALKASGAVLLVIVLAAGAAYFYLGFAPAADEPELSGELTEHTTLIDGTERAYALYTPADLPVDAPLILALHGSTQTGERMREHTGYELDVHADERGFAVAYPDGIGRAWNECREQSATTAVRDDVADVEFLQTVVAETGSSHGVSADDVYAFGYSNGGQMAYRLALEVPGMLSGVATVGSNLPDPGNFDCPLDRPTVPMMFVYGTEDRIVPYEGGESSLFGLFSRGEILSADDSLDTWAEANGLDPADADVETLPAATDDGTRVELVAVPSDGASHLAEDSPHLVQFVVHGGGHVIPQQRYRPPRALGTVTEHLDAPAAAVEFFFDR